MGMCLIFILIQALEKVSTLREQQEREENHNPPDCSGRDGRRASATAELLRIKDHLIEIEKNVSFCGGVARNWVCVGVSRVCLIDKMSLMLVHIHPIAQKLNLV